MNPACAGIVRHYASGPVDGLILAATSGEGMSLATAELERLVTVVRDELSDARRYLSICLGLSGASTAKMLDTLDETAAWPIDGYLIASPYYIRPSQHWRRKLQHFTALADHASWPIVLYNIYRTAVNLDNETLLELAGHPNIVGMKDCCADRAVDRLPGAAATGLSCTDRRGRAIFRRSPTALTAPSCYRRILRPSFAAVRTS